MNATRLCCCFLALLVALTACATSSGTVSLPEVKPDMGLVVFYRQANMKGRAIRFEISDSAKGSIGYLSDGTVVHRDLEPGSHTFTVRAPSVDGQDSVTLDVEAGQTYYVKGTVLWGWPAGRPKFTRMSDSQAQSDLSKM